MKKLITCVKDLTGFVAENFAVMSTSALTDTKKLYKTLGYDSEDAVKRVQEHINSAERSTTNRINKITAAIDSLKLPAEDKADLVNFAIAQQVASIAGPVDRLRKTVSQSNAVIKFLDKQLETDGKFLKDGDIQEFVLDNAVDSILLNPQHAIRGNNAWYDGLLKDFFGEEGLSGISGKVTPENKAKALKIMKGEFNGKKSLVEYVMNEAEVPALNKTTAEDRITLAMSKGSDEGYDDPVLNLIANSYKHFRDKYNARMGILDNNFEASKANDFGRTPDREIVAANISAFREFAIRHFDRGEFLGLSKYDLKSTISRNPDKVEELFTKELDEYIKSIVHNDSFSREAAFKQSEHVYKDRNIVIEDTNIRAQYHRQFTHRYGGPLLADITYKRNRLKLATFAQNTHMNIGRMLGDIKFYLKTVKKINPDKIDRVLGRSEAKIQDMIGARSLLDPSQQNIVRGINSMMSTLTGASALRNWYDYVGHSAMVEALVTSPGAPITRVFKMLKPLVKNTFEFVGGTGGAIRDNIGSSLGRTRGRKSLTTRRAEFFERNGAYIQISSATINRGFSDALEGAKLMDDASGFSKGFNKFAEKSQDIVNDFGLADATNIAGRTMHTRQINGMILDVLENSYKEVKKSPLGRKLERYDIGEKEWAVLQKLEDIGADEFGVNLAKKLTYTEEELLATIRGTGKQGMDLVKAIGKAQRPSEIDTVYTFNRVISSLQNLINQSVDELATTPGVRGATFSGKSDSFIKAIYDMSIGKFLNITFSQWFALYRAMLDAIGLNPNTATHFNMAHLKDPRMLALMGSALTAQAGAGYLYMTMKDLAKGDAPRNLDQQTLLEAALSNGFGGVWGTMAGSLMYGDVPFGSPLSAFIRPAKNLGKAILSDDDRRKGDRIQGAAVDLAKRIASPLDIWYMRGIQDKLIRQYFVPETRRRRRWKRKKGQDQSAKQWIQGVFE